MVNFLKQSRTQLWLLIVGSAALVIGTCYTMVQQSTRLAAGDLPLATAQTAYNQLNNGASPADVVPKTKTNLSSDSTAFVIITDSSRNVLASSADLNGKTPLPPEGVFSYTKNNRSDSLTWQPDTGVRLATEVLSYSNGSNSYFIIAGQSLQSAEDRTSTYGALALAGWIAVVFWATLILCLPGVQATKAKK